MITTREQYEEVLALLTARDTRRNPHRLPIEQYSLSEGEFFFTICARHCGQPFSDPMLAKRIIDALLWRRVKHGWLLYCYCLMPDHLHFIVSLLDAERKLRNAGARGFEVEGLLHQIGDFKSYTTSQIWWPYGGSGELWQRSSHDHVIRYNDKIDHAVEYVLNNSTRKQLVEDWRQYPHAGIVDSYT